MALTGSTLDLSPVTRSKWALGLTLLSLLAFTVAAVLNVVEGGPVDARVALILAATASGVSVLLQLLVRRRTQRNSSAEKRL